MLGGTKVVDNPGGGGGLGLGTRVVLGWKFASSLWMAWKEV